MRFIFLITLFMFLICGNSGAKEVIVYSHLTDHYWQIWMMDATGTHKKQITTSKKDKRDPVILDKGRIAFRTNNGRLYISDLNGNEWEILKKYANINNPDFSKETDRAVFVRFDPRAIDKSEIWKADLNNEQAFMLTRDGRLKYQPQFSPKGDRIAFVKADEDNRHHHIWIMNADGSDARQLTSGAGFNTLPEFSPDGGSVFFASNRQGRNYEIYAVNISSGKVRRLTRDPGLDSSPSVSPDGQRIAFVSNRSGDQQIWVMDASGKNFIQLTNGENESVDPEWGVLGVE